MTKPSLQCCVIFSLFFGSVVYAHHPGEQADHLMPNIPAYRTSAPSEAPAIRFEVELPKVSKRLPVMLVSAPDIGNQVESLQKKLRLHNKPIETRSGKIILSNSRENEVQQKSLILYAASGGFYFEHEGKVDPVTEKALDLPDDKNAYEIAHDYLKRHELLSDDIETDIGQVQFSRAVLSEFDGRTGRTLRSFDTGIDVRFPQRWEGYRVTGPGSKLYVSIGDGGEVVALTSMHRKAKASGSSLPAIDPESAVDLLKKGYGRMSVTPECKTAVVTDMTLAYWSESPKSEQRMALPVYQISGYCDNPEDLQSFEAFAPAVRNAAFDIRTVGESKPRRDDEA